MFVGVKRKLNSNFHLLPDGLEARFSAEDVKHGFDADPHQLADAHLPRLFEEVETGFHIAEFSVDDGSGHRRHKSVSAPLVQLVENCARLICSTGLDQGFAEITIKRKSRG